MTQPVHGSLKPAKNPIPCVISSNYKGGTGKSVTSRVLAQGMLQRPEFTQGKRVLMLDLDPQGNQSERWGLLTLDMDGNSIPIPHPDLDGQYSAISDLWLPQLGLGEESLVPVPYPTTEPGIDCVPVHEAHMLMINRYSTPELEVELAQRLITWLRSEQVAEQYCAVIIDTQPSKAPLIDLALRAGTHCYIPFIPEAQSIQGVFSIINYIGNIDSTRMDGTNLKIIGLLPNLYRENEKNHREHLAILSKHEVFSKLVMPVRLARRTVYSATDNPAHLPGSVTGTTANPKARAEALRFTDYIISQLTQEN